MAVARPRVGRPPALELSTPLHSLRGVGPSRAASLAAAGFDRVSDLIHHLPFRYEDRRSIRPISLIEKAGAVTLRARLSQLKVIRTRRRRFSIVKGFAEDDSGVVAVTWFNRPYLANQVKPGTEVLLHGELRAAPCGWELLNPTCENAAAAIHSARIVPIYPAAGDLGPAILRRLLAEVVEAIDLAAQIPDDLPPRLRESYGLPPVGRALATLHAPPDDADVEELNARRSPSHLRLIYGELFELQLELALLRARQVRARKNHSYTVDDRVRAVARAILPFRLTAAQKRVTREIADDLRGPHPMLRLLQGDVGSGKTIVAALALVLAIESGLQGAFMAPTELLAEQHFASLRRLLGSRYRIALLTSANPSRADRRAIAQGEAQLAVGTHALIQQSVTFQRLGLAVIDEQHRFGVAQRRSLQVKGDQPDVLVMTATPIPRTLALTVYGDLEISVLDELPPGRTPIVTEVAPARERKAVYQRLREALDTGARAYVVLPLIEHSDEVRAGSLERLGQKLREFLVPHPSALLHGRLPAAERDVIMKAFASGEITVLISTTVIEVGVDVPEATWMVIESAERFGLAQLHQLRGRVGRGAGASRCIAIHDRTSEEGRRRLAVFAGTGDGFAIAEADLEIRGPGDLLGTRQSGLPLLRVADLLADREWLERARVDAREALPLLGQPEFGALRERLETRVSSRYQRFAGG